MGLLEILKLLSSSVTCHFTPAQSFLPHHPSIVYDIHLNSNPQVDVSNRNFTSLILSLQNMFGNIILVGSEDLTRTATCQNERRRCRISYPYNWGSVAIRNCPGVLVDPTEWMWTVGEMR